MISKKERNNTIILSAAFVVLAMLFLSPFYFVIVNSFKTMGEITRNNAALPQSINFNNFIEAFHKMNFINSFMNTLVITVFSNLGWILFAPMSAYYLTRTQTKSSQLLFTLIIASMSIPFQAVMIPMVVVSKQLHLLNSLPGVIVIYTGLAIPFALFMCSGSLRYIPIEIEEAALIDGCNKFKMFWRIVFPLMKSTIVTVTVLNTFWFWNDFLLPQVLLQKKTARTLQLSINYLFGEYLFQWNVVLPALLLSILPIVIFFIIMQKYIIEGVAAGAVKS